MHSKYVQSVCARGQEKVMRKCGAEAAGWSLTKMSQVPQCTPGGNYIRPTGIGHEMLDSLGTEHGCSLQMQPPGVPPLKPLLAANFDTPPSTRGTRHSHPELGSRAPAPSPQAEASWKGATTAQGPSARIRGQPSAGDRQALRLEPVGICGLFGVPLPCPHAPLSLDKEGEHVRVGGWEGPAGPLLAL